MRQRRLAQRAAARQAARLLTFLALLGVLVILVAARADVESSLPERIPEPDTPAAYADALAEVQPPEKDAPPVNSSAPTTTAEPSPYEGIAVSEDELYMLACLVWHESRGEPYEGQVAVAEVVLNRCLSAGFPDTISEVIFQRYPGQRYQFSPAPYLYSAQPGETQYAAVRDALDGTELTVPTNTVFFSTEPYNSNIVAIIGNHYFCTL